MTKPPMPRGGRPSGARNILQRAFLEDLADAWKRDGVAAIKVMAKEDPGGFVKTVAALMPRDIVLGSALGEIDDDGLDDLILQMRQRLIETRQQQPPMTLIAADMKVEKVSNGK